MKKNRLIAGLLALLMLAGLLPTTAMAAQTRTADSSGLVNIARQATLTHSEAVIGEWLPEIDPISNLVNGSYDDQFRWINEGIQTYISEKGVEPSVTLTFQGNRSIGGFKIGVLKEDREASHRYVYHILGKAEGDADYRELAKGEATKASDNCVNTHTLSKMEELSSIKVAFTNESDDIWPIFSEIEILGEGGSTVDPDPSLDGLIEVARLPETKITVPSNENNADLMVDGNTSTFWAASEGRWPADVDFALPGNMLIKRVEVDFEHYNGRTFDLRVDYAVNNVTSNYIMLPETEATGHSANSTYSHTWSTGLLMSHVRIHLEGTNGLAYPAIAEVRIYAVNEEIDLDDYDDITRNTETSEETSEESDAKAKVWDFGSNQQVVGFRVELKDGATAKVLGKMKRDAGWTTYVSELANGDNVLSFSTSMSAVRVEMDDFSKLTSFQIYGTYTEPKTDRESAAFDKPTHGNFDSGNSSYLVNDGDTATAWQPEMYPAYVDIDLEENYNIREIQLFTGSEGYSHYSVYTSMDGKDFTLVGEPKMNNDPCGADGDKLTLTPPREARIVRVYLEYYSEGVKPVLNEVRVIGTASETPIQTAPAVNVGKFEDSDYADPITNEDVIAEVQGIIERQVDADYVDWFTLDIKSQANGYDYFTLSDEGGKIKVTGNNGVSLATGVNHYLKYFCNVHISQVGNQVDMPDSIVPVGTAVHRETKFPVRYAYNYCTHSYSMSFWNEEEWRNELDWLALNGVNVVLDITGQEEVWRQFLMELGYSHQEAKDFLAGPGYYAWAYMANLTGFGGPIHDSFLTERVDLGRKNQRIMRTLGMEPVLQAFSGMVPVDITTKDPSAQVIPQGDWCSFQRPAMLKTDTETYDEYAAKFYKAQKDVFGDAKYYATDPFHEGGNAGGMSYTTVASELLDSLLEFDSDAVWVIQSWQGNPSNALLAGLNAGTNPTRTDRRENALVLDLWAEHSPHNNEYGADTDGDGIKEFSDTPWVWCMLNNFGGRMGLHGHLDALQQAIPAAANSAQHMAGIGISPEGSQENPLLYDFLFETIWTQNADGELGVINLEQWLKNYARRRYGAQSDNAEQAMAILADTVYKDSLNRAGQGAPESVVNARPALTIGAASTWGNSSIAYDKVELEKAARLLLADYDTLSASDAYLYDVADVLKQVLSNSAQNIHSKMAAAYMSGDKEEFAAQAEKFLALIDLVDEVLGTRSEFTFGKWTGGAVKMAQSADDFTKRLYLRNAKALVTTWGSIQQCNGSGLGGLADYSNRQWAGLTKDFYKVRWTAWINACKDNLAKDSTVAPSFDWFSWEWAYARDSKLYSSDPNNKDLSVLGQTVLDNYGAGPEAFDTNDIDHTGVTAKAGSQEASSSAASKVLDGDNTTIWHTAWSSSLPAASEKWIAFDLGQETKIDGLRYLPRQDGNKNGIITSYKIYVSSKETDWAGTTNTWTEVAGGTWASNSDWKKASFAETTARYVKLLSVDGVGGFASAAEIRITGPKAAQPPQPQTYNITYDLAGGALAEGLSNPATYTENTETITLKNPTRVGYTFAGWMETGLTTATETVTIPKGSTGDRSYTATWTPQTYTITYNLAGGTVDGTNPASYTVESAEIVLINPTRDGHTFAGWTGADLDEATETVTIPNGSTGNRSYTATWTENEPEPSEPVTPSTQPEQSTPVTPVAPSKPVEPSTTTTTEIIENGDTVTTVTDLETGDITVTVSAPDGSQSKIVSQEGSTAVESVITQEAVDNAGGGAVVLPVAGLTVQAEPTVTVTLPEGAGPVAVSIPVTEIPAGAVAVRVNPDGTRQIIAESLTEDGVLTVPINGTETIRIIDNSRYFQDVEEDHWFAADVAYASSRGLFVGTEKETFSPQETMSRKMLATVLYRYAGEPETDGTTFEDVPGGTYYGSAVSWAVENNVVLGVGENRFAPDAAVSREQLAVMLYRFAGRPETDGESLAGFADEAQVSGWARQAMDWAVSNGIIRGAGGSRLIPGAEATRAEVAAMLHRFTQAGIRRA